MATPTVISVTPNNGRTGGRQLIVVKGTNFQLPPPPAPMQVGKLTPSPGPSVEVLFGQRKAREVRVLSSELLHVVSPIGDPGQVALTVRNVDQSGAVVPGESVTVPNAFTFGRPDTARKPSNETTFQRAVRQLIVELRRQVIDNVTLATHTDYADSPSGANVAALAELPGLVLSGPRLVENREYSLNQKRKVGDTELYPPRTVDLEFTLIGVDRLQLPMLALMHECEMFFQRNIVLSLPKDAADPLGEQIEYDMDIAPDGHFSSIGSPGNSNVRAFSGTFRVQGIDLDDDDMRSGVTYPISDLSRAGVGGAMLNTPSPALLLNADSTGPAGVAMAPPVQDGRVLRPGLTDGIQQLGATPKATSAALLTEDGEALTDEDGNTLILE